MKNQSPGSPDLSVMSFKSAFHGRMLGSLSLTRSKAVHKLDIPAFDWPAVTFPLLKYPLEDFHAENAETEARALAEVEATIIEWKKTRPVAALIVEPIQSGASPSSPLTERDMLTEKTEGGDNHASNAFFNALRTLTKEHGVFFIVDEVQTGVGATGSFWAHEKWNLDTPPDFVSFRFVAPPFSLSHTLMSMVMVCSKKMQAAGYYHAAATRAPGPYRSFVPPIPLSLPHSPSFIVTTHGWATQSAPSKPRRSSK